MSTEDQTTLSPEDKAIRDAAAAERRNLSEGAADDVPRGDEAQPPAKRDPYADRKGLFAKHRQQREQRIAGDLDETPALRATQDAVAAAADREGSTHELRRGEDLDTERSGRGESVRPGRAPEAPARDYDVDPDSGRVKVRIVGKDYYVPEADIIAAGGLATYQKVRAANVQLAEANRIKREAEDKLKRLEAAGPSAPANSPAAQPGQGPSRADGPGSSAELEAEAERITKDLYSGDPKKAREAIARIISAAGSRGPNLDPAEVARQAAALLKEQQGAPPSAGTAGDDAAVRSVEVEQVNEMMASKYGDLLDDPVLRNAALSRFNAARADANNAGRSLVDIAREIAEDVRASKPAGSGRGAVLERKRSLPTPPSAGKAPAPGAGAPTTTTPSGYIALMRQRAGRPS